MIIKWKKRLLGIRSGSKGVILWPERDGYMYIHEELKVYMGFWE